MPEPDDPGLVSIGARFIALVLLAAGVQLWVNHHLGLTSQTPWVALGLGTLSGALGLAARLLDGLRQVLRGLLHPGLLTWLWGITLVTAMFVSSVLVIPGDGNTRGKATIRSAERHLVGQRDLGSGVARFVVLTSPFGRPYRLGVDGFLEETIAVYPLAGLKLTPERARSREVVRCGSRL